MWIRNSNFLYEKLLLIFIALKICLHANCIKSTSTMMQILYSVLVYSKKKVYLLTPSSKSHRAIAEIITFRSLNVFEKDSCVAIAKSKISKLIGSHTFNPRGNRNKTPKQVSDEFKALCRCRRFNWTTDHWLCKRLGFRCSKLISIFSITVSTKPKVT